MKCPPREHIQGLYDNTLSHFLEKRVEAHLQVCRKCQEAYRAIEAEDRAARIRKVAPMFGLDPDTATQADIDRADRMKIAQGFVELEPDQEDVTWAEIEEGMRAFLATLALRSPLQISDEEMRLAQIARGHLAINEFIEEGKEPSAEDN